MMCSFLQSARLGGDAAAACRDKCVEGMAPTRPRIDIAQLLGKSLMLVTALQACRGRDKAAAAGAKAHKEGATLKAAALELGCLADAQFQEWVRPETMVGPTPVAVMAAQDGIQ